MIYKRFKIQALVLSFVLFQAGFPALAALTKGDAIVTGGSRQLPTLETVRKTTPRVLEARQGGDSSGGGSGLYRHGPNDRPHLLDYVAHFPQWDEPESATDLIIRPTAQRIHPSSSIDFVRPADQPAWSLLLSRLATWRHKSPAVVSAIEFALLNMEFYAADSVQQRSRFFIPDLLRDLFPQLEVQTIVSYATGIHGGVVNRPLWPRLGQYSQAGVLLHEAFRHIQMYDETVDSELNTNEAMSDELLQLLTAKIMLTDPSGDETLDDPGTFRGLIGSFLFFSEESQRLRKQDLCARMERWVDFTPQEAAKQRIQLASLTQTFNDQCVDSRSDTRNTSPKRAALELISSFYRSIDNSMPFLLTVCTNRSDQTELMRFRDDLRLLFFESRVKSLQVFDLDAVKTNFRLKHWMVSFPN